MTSSHLHHVQEHSNQHHGRKQHQDFEIFPDQLYPKSAKAKGELYLRHIGKTDTKNLKTAKWKAKDHSCKQESKIVNCIITLKQTRSNNLVNREILLKPFNKKHAKH